MACAAFTQLSDTEIRNQDLHNSAVRQHIGAGVDPASCCAACFAAADCFGFVLYAGLAALTTPNSLKIINGPSG